MSKQSAYTVHSGDECGGDPCYNVLKGPAGFECWLTEPEDRSFWRDLSPVVERLESLEQSNTQLREQNRVLVEALQEIANDVKGNPKRKQMLADDDFWAAPGEHTLRQWIAKAALTATSQPGGTHEL